ncbi:7-carboxy-7-deazaguanine synthase QueE [Parathermosynechococcus lividus]
MIGDLDLEGVSVPLVEIFSAIQGEGANVGTRQLFIRFAGCDLRCTYCDSAHTWGVPAIALLETIAGDRQFQRVANPLSGIQILAAVAQLHHPHLHDSISLTGGEPLLHALALATLLPALRAATQLPLYLETGGHHPRALERVLPYLDSVGMDIKLPSVSGECHWPAHQQFLTLCDRAGVEVFCKVIISALTTPTDLATMAELVATVNPRIPVFLQPVTPIGTGRLTQPPTPAQVLAWQAYLKKDLAHVRVIPQTHKFLGQR